MTSKATYHGSRPVFGIEKDEEYTLNIRTHTSEHGQPYLWVRVEELPAYLMPYGSMMALLGEWDFREAKEAAYIDQLDLADRWLDIYKPAEVSA